MNRFISRVLFFTAAASAFAGVTAVAPNHASADARQSIVGALTLHDDVLTEFSRAEFGQKTQMALNELVEYACRSLEYYGYNDDAAQARKEWSEQFANYFTSAGTLDLGDHAPLSQWLADFYKKLRLRFGDLLVNMLHLDDINTLNYAIPVAFQPRGDKSGDQWDRLEYSYHFVPFAAIVTYWGSYGACVYFTKGEPGIRRFCKQIAGLLKTGMSLWIAPKLSDYIFTKANNLPRRDLDVDRYELRAYYEKQISRFGQP